MEINNFSYIFFIMIAVIGLIFGVLLGALLASAFGSKKKTPEPGRGKDLVEVLRVYRDQSNGDLNVEVAGQLFKRATDLDNRWRAAIARVLQDLSVWMGGASINQRVASLSQSGAVPAIPAPDQQSAVPAAAATTAVAATTVASEAKPVSANIVDFMAAPVNPEKAKQLVEAKSIAIQIDEIIREKQPQSPVRDRYIRILELPIRGVVVYVDSKEYQGVGDVEDPQVKAFLKECVTEWESRVGAAR